MLSIAIHAFGQIADSSASNYLFYTQQMDAIFVPAGADLMIRAC